MEDQLVQDIALVLTDARFTPLLLGPTASAALKRITDRLDFDEEYRVHGSTYEALRASLSMYLARERRRMVASVIIPVQTENGPVYEPFQMQPGDCQRALAQLWDKVRKDYP